MLHFLFFICLGFFLTSCDSNNKPTVYHTSDTIQLTPVPLYIIGDSTVNNMTSIHNKRVEWGWGNVIDELMKQPNLKYNRARSGTSSKTYYLDTPTWSSDHYWGNGTTPNQYGKKGMAQLILESNISQGAFLLIYFGGNDAINVKTPHYHKQTAPEKNIAKLKKVPNTLTSYEYNLRKYIDFSLDHNITPVLITPTSRMKLYDHSDCPNYGKYVSMLSCSAQLIYKIPTASTWNKNPFQGQVLDYAQAMKDLQKEYSQKNKKVLLLDLTTASMQHYQKVADINGTSEKNKNKYIRKLFSYDDPTHFNYAGAKEMAKLIKTLACSNSGDQKLCYQFK